MASSVATQLLGSLIIAFVEANEPTSADEDFIFGQMDVTMAHEAPESADQEHVEELLKEARQIRSNSGVGSPEVAKYVDGQAAALLGGSPKSVALRSLAEQLYNRRPVLYLKGHSEPLPATVLLRSVRKPSVGALSTGISPAGLFKSPDNSFIIIKFDPQFGYADIIVDPFFTDAFIQQPSTATYSTLLAALPRAFVGTAAELRKMVALLTAESIKAYASKGVTCPPWRRFDAMLARWLPKMFNDDVITHGPAAPAAAAAPRPATAALNPSLFAAAPALGNRLQLRRDDSMDSTSSSDSSSTAVGGASPAADSSGEMSQSLASSSSSSAASVISSSGSHVSGHSVIYGFDIPSKQQQQPKSEDTTTAKSAAEESFSAAKESVDTAAEPTAAAVAGHKGLAAAGPAEVAVEDSIKAVYPTATLLAPVAVVSSAAEAAVAPASSDAKQALLLTKTPSLPIPGPQKAKQKQFLSSNSITNQILVANGYGKPRVVKLGGVSSINPLVGPAAAAAIPPASGVVGVHSTTANAANGNQHVCCGGMRDSSNSSSSLKRDRGMFETFQLPGDAAAAVKVRPEWEGPMQGSGYIRGVNIAAGFERKSTDVKGLAAVVAEYKDTVLRVGVDPRQETRVVAGRRVVRLCSSPDHVIQGFVREGARAA